ncbi:MAG: type II secretion system major pseudopilin GspG [Pseudomonadota bacterium]
MSDLPSPAATPTRRRHADAEAPDAGLTLLELLVVVTILVLLSAAVGTVALNYLSGAKADAARIQMSQLEAGLDLYRLDIGRYPTEAEGLSALVEAPGGLQAWNGPYVRKESSLVDPWGNAFIYAEAEGGKTFALTSLGADGREGGEDEDADVIN